MRVVSAPFRRTSGDRLLAEVWQLSVGSNSDALPAYLPHWDANVDLRLARSVVVDVDGVREDCGLGPDDLLRLVGVWRSSGTTLRGAGAVVDLPASGLQAAVLQVEIPGTSLASDVEICTQLVLARSSASSSPAPQIAGSILWEDSADLSLEGTASRFPLEVADFDQVSWAPSGAGWFLVWNADSLEQPLLRGTRLVINSRHQAVVDAIQATFPTADQQAIRSAIYYDVGRSLIRGALNNDDFIAGSGSYADGTVGRAIHRLVRALFPADSNAALKSALDERPDHFDSRLQWLLRLFRG